MSTKNLFIPLALILLMGVGCGSDHQNEPLMSIPRDQRTADREEVTPFGQKELTELNIANSAPYYSVFEGVETSEMDKAAFLDYAYGHGMMFYGAPIQCLKFSVGSESFFGCCPSNGMLYSSAYETSIEIKRLFMEDSPEYLPYLYEVVSEYVDATGADTRSEAVVVTQDPSDASLLKIRLPENDTPYFRKVRIDLKTLIDVPSMAVSGLSEPIHYYWIVLQFPWSDDAALLDDPVITDLGISVEYPEK